MPTPANTSVYSVRVLRDVGVVGVGGDSAVAGGERRTPKARGRSAGGDDGVQRVGAILVFLCLRGRPWGEWKDAQREKRKPPAARNVPRIPPAFIRALHIHPSTLAPYTYWIHPPDTIITKVQSLPMDARVSIRLYILTLKHCPPLSPTHLFPVAPSPVSSSSLVSIRPVQSPLSPSCPVTGFPSASLFLSCCTSPQGRLLHEGVTVHSRVYSVLSSCSLVYAHANASPVWDKETNASGVSVKTRTGRGRGTNRRGATTTLMWIHPTAVVVSVVYEV